MVTYHPNLARLEWTIRCYHHILQDSDRLRQAIPSFPIITLCRPRNLRDLMVFSLTKKISPATFAAKLEGAKAAPFWLPLMYYPAVSQNHQHDLFNLMQEVWSPICRRNQATSSLPDEQRLFKHCPWSYTRIYCGDPFHQQGPQRS